MFCLIKEMYARCRPWFLGPMKIDGKVGGLETSGEVQKPFILMHTKYKFLAQPIAWGITVDRELLCSARRLKTIGVSEPNGGKHHSFTANQVIGTHLCIPKARFYKNDDGYFVDVKFRVLIFHMDGGDEVDFVLTFDRDTFKNLSIPPRWEINTCPNEHDLAMHRLTPRHGTVYVPTTRQALTSIDLYLTLLGSKI